MKNEHSAGVIVFFDDIIDNQSKRKYLLLNYRKGHWDLPKGKLEGSETKIQAAIRELKEETSLEADIYPGFEQSLSYLFKDRLGELIKKEVTFFVGKAKLTQVVLSPEHVLYQWLPLKDALRQLTYNNAQQILNIADQFLVDHDSRK